MKLLQDVSNIIPPLSDADSFELCVKLPILAVALTGRDDTEDDMDKMETDESIEDITSSMLPGLTEYVLCHGFDTTSRSAAASCIHAIIALGGRNRPACPVKPLVLEIVNPATASAIDIISVKDCLNILALMVSKPQGYRSFLPDHYG
jgi:hypothetical protein